MNSNVVAVVTGLFVGWLFVKDARQARAVSAALWVPILWVFIIGTKPASLWLGLRPDLGSTVIADDTLLDKGLYLLLIVAALFVLARRRVNWQWTISANKWLLIYFLYLGLSILWSDASIVALKRWIKDFGNVLMVLVILSEKDPVQSVRAFLARCAFLFVPLSVLVVKYIPSISMQFTKWEGEALFVGISTNKNLFGMTMCACALALFWLWLDAREPAARAKDRTGVFRYSILLLMTAWLVLKSNSSTALACSVLGCGLMASMKFTGIRRQMKHLGLITMAALGAVILMQATGLWALLTSSFAAAVGRDPSFHGRTEIWSALLKQDINPLLGVGYYSFWTEERMQKLSQGYHYLLNEAHNGYLETYLNSGLLGLLLLIVLIATSARQMKRDMVDGVSYASLRFSFLLSAVFYAVSEAIFNRLLMTWFVLLLAVLVPPRIRGYKRLQENVASGHADYGNAMT